jgi:phosphinothricin acetyltransferase
MAWRDCRSAGEGIILRSAVPADAELLLALYRPIVVDTAISFELEPPSVDQFRDRIELAISRWAWIVAERSSKPVAYAYGSAQRTRAAYRWSVETSIIVAPDHQRSGVGRTLYLELLRQLAYIGYCSAFAAIALPYAPSIALHRRLGFEHIGVFVNVGRKFGRWHDVSWWQRRLRDTPLDETPTFS